MSYYIVYLLSYFREREQHYYDNQRPDTGAVADEYLVNWQKQNNLYSNHFNENNYQNRRQHKSADLEVDNNDVSFVGESKFINSSISSVDNLFPSPAPSVDPVYKKKQTQRSLTRYDSNSDLIEKSLDSKSIFYELGERPSILNSSISFPRQVTALQLHCCL